MLCRVLRCVHPYGVLHSAGLFWYSACTKMPSNVRGQFFRVLNVHIFGVKRAWSVPLGTQRKQKHLETCMASTREDVGPGPSRKLVPVKRLIISCLRDSLGLPVSIYRAPIAFYISPQPKKQASIEVCFFFWIRSWIRCWLYDTPCQSSQGRG